MGGWSCGAPQSQSSGCVSGVAPGSHTDLQPSLVKLTRYDAGITFDIGGDALKEAQTCFCGSDLCNTADFTGTTTYTTITTGSSTISTAAPPSTIIATIFNTFNIFNIFNITVYFSPPASSKVSNLRSLPTMIAFVAAAILI